MSGTATTTTGDSTTDTPPPPDSSAGDAPPPPPETTSDSGECPYGTEGCLCDVGAMCDEGLMCNDEGVCVAPPACVQLDMDAHADEATAQALEAVDCGNGVDLGVFATLFGPETDWYTYQGTSAFGCPENPSAVVVTDITTNVCVYIECITGDLAPVTCGDGSVDAMSPDGRTGCCGQDQATIAGYDCFGIGANKDVNVFVSVGTDQESCSDYALSYAI